MDQLGSLLDRPKAYSNVDGVGELGMGFMCLGYALMGWLQVATPQNSVWNRIYTFWIFLGLMCTTIHYGSKAIKKRITYRRTGFVEYRARDTFWRPVMIGLVVSTLASVALFVSLRSHWNLTTLAPLTGLGLAACYAYGFARAVRWKWVVVWVMTFTSLMIAILPADLVGALANHSWITAVFPAKLVGALVFTMMLYGTTLLISGGISFWLYLRRTQAPPQES
jgi:hypothetical protein